MPIVKGSVALSSVSLAFRAAFPKIRDAVGLAVNLYDRKFCVGTLSYPGTLAPIAPEVLFFVSLQLVAAYSNGLEVTRAADRPHELPSASV